MLKGIYLTIMVGPVIPVPIPKVALDALQSIQINVYAQPKQQSGFRLEFSLANNSPLQTIFLLAGGASLVPFLRVILMATINGIPNVLMDGVITKVDVAPGGSSSEYSKLTVTGVDLTAMMDFLPFDGLPYPAMPIEARVLAILAKYAFLGIIPVVIPTILLDVPIPTENIPRQQGTDYKYITQLADDCGYIFYITPGPAPGTNTAYFGPEVKVGVPQSALNINMDAHTNVESLSFSFNSEGATLPIFFVQLDELGIPLAIPVPLPSVSLLQPPLGVIPPIPKNIELMDDTANLSLAEAAMRGLTLAGRSQDAVTANGSLDVVRYGSPLSARQLVGVRGAGMAFDGLYYVTSVTHDIKLGEYKQNFTLSRNALVSITPTVPA
ncbi:MAG TPA: hypothetical protein VGI19_08390 [Candidatus Cybelea sp.]|jgi:hypothetical protein